MTQAAEMTAPVAQPTTGAPLLEVRNLTKTFGGLTAVGDLDLQVYPGEIVSIIGPNGAGKTTVFNLITGLYHPNTILESASNRVSTGFRLAGRRLSFVLLRRPTALGRWLFSTLFGLGFGVLFIVYVLNVLLDATLTPALVSYLPTTVLICVVAWVVLYPLVRILRQFFGPAHGFWADLDTEDTGVGGFQGSIRLEGQSLVGVTPDIVLARGVARTYQNIRLF